MKLAVVYKECAKGHPHISRAPGLHGGVPHIVGTQVTVSELLARLYVHGSIAAVVSYCGDIAEEQAQDALAYAQRFMELACNPHALTESEG